MYFVRLEDIMNINRIKSKSLSQPNGTNCSISPVSSFYRIKINNNPNDAFCKKTTNDFSFKSFNKPFFTLNSIPSFGNNKVAPNKNSTPTDLDIKSDICEDFSFIKGKKNIFELTVEEKRKLLENLKKHKNEILYKNSKSLPCSDIVPKDLKEYSQVFNTLLTSIGIIQIPADSIVLEKYEKAMENMAAPDSQFLNTKITRDNFKLNLSYPRKDFINDVLNKVKILSESEKQKVFDYFGFEIKENKDNIIQMSGYPKNIYNKEKLKQINELLTQTAIEQIKPLIDKFNNNKINIEGKSELSEQLNSICDLFPEFKSIIGKAQHKTHHFTVDVHTLKVLQGIMSDSEYKTLSPQDKRILNVVALMHDITKAEEVVDKTHPHCSAIDTYHLLKRTNFTETEKNKIYTLINTHDWLEHYNGRIYTGNGNYRGFTDEEKATAAKKIALELKNNNMFKMARMLAKADLIGVKEDNSFFERFKSAFEQGVVEIPKYFS